MSREPRGRIEAPIIYVGVDGQAAFKKDKQKASRTNQLTFFLDSF